MSQVDGTSELMRYLLLHIKLSPTLYAPSGVAAQILTWAKEQQHRVDLSMVSTEETTQVMLVLPVLNPRLASRAAGTPCLLA